jgi:hypothetical protein
MKILSVLLPFILIVNLCAESFFESASNRYDEITSSSEFQTLQRAYDTYRSSRNQERLQDNIHWIARDEEGVEHAYLIEDDQSNREARIICHGCPSVGKLAGQVNDIVQKLVEQQENPYPGLLHEVGRLEGMYYLELQKTRHTESNNPNCLRLEMDILQDPRKNDFNKELAVLIWDKEINMNKIGSIQMRIAGKRTYYFKSGLPPEQKIIRVQVTGTDKVKISYFHMIRPNQAPPTPLDPEEIKKRKKQQQIDSAMAKVRQKKQRKNLLGLYTYLDENIAGTQVRGSLGVAIEHRHGIPRHVDIIDIRTQTELPQGYKLESEVKVSSKRQEAKFILKDKDRTYVKVKTSTSDTSVTLPYSLTVTQAKIKIDTEVSNTTKHSSLDNQLEAKLSLSSVAYGNIADMYYRYDDESNAYGITQKRKFGDGTLTLGVENKSNSNGLGSSETRAYMKYSIEF